MSDGNQLLCEKHNDPDVLCRGCFNQLKAELEETKRKLEISSALHAIAIIQKEKAKAELEKWKEDAEQMAKVLDLVSQDNNNCDVCSYNIDQRPKCVHIHAKKALSLHEKLKVKG